MAKKANTNALEPVANCDNLNQEKSLGEIIIYNPDDSIKLNVWMERETVWLTIKQLSYLFGRDRTVIGRHIKNIFSEGELDQSLVCAKFAHTGEYGRTAGYTQTKDVDFYNLDVIISVGYRIKSVRGTRFRQWANAVLKDYLIKGYAINPRLEQLERRVTKTEEKIDFFIKTSLPPVEGIFFDGQIYDAYEFVCGLIKSASRYSADLRGRILPGKNCKRKPLKLYLCLYINANPIPICVNESSILLNRLIIKMSLA